MSPLAGIMLGLRTQTTIKAHKTIRKAIGSDLPVSMIQTKCRTLGRTVEVICYTGLRMGVSSTHRLRVKTCWWPKTIFPMSYQTVRPRVLEIISPQILCLALEIFQFPARTLSRGRTAAQARSQTQESISRGIRRECQAKSIIATDVNTPTQPTKNNTREFHKCGMVPWSMPNNQAPPWVFLS